MGVVHLFGLRNEDSSGERATPEAVNENRKPAEVVELVINSKIAKGIPAKTIYRQMEALMVTHGVDFSCEKTKSDYKLITYLLQGVMDRVDGTLSSDRSLWLQTLRVAFETEVPIPDDTEEKFGDLLSQFD